MKKIKQHWFWPFNTEDHIWLVEMYNILGLEEPKNST